MPFKLASPFPPLGDQPQAIEKLLKRLRAGEKHSTLLGVTGSGKTFTMANVIQALDRPTLILSHNKTLAAQLYSEFKQFFPENAVEYFVSYFDYYQPEAYIPLLSHPVFFIFSDDPAWAQQNIRPTAETIHVDSDTSPAGALRDFQLMTRCRHHIVANSTFSWWGAWLAAHPDQEVVAPSRWGYRAAPAANWTVIPN